MAKLLVAAQNLATGVRKGDIVEVYDDSYGWGTKEALPNFIRAVITDRTKAQVDNYLSDVQKLFKYNIDTQNVNGVRATITVDTALSGSSNLGLKLELKNFILAGADVVLVVWDGTQWVVTEPLAGGKVTLHAQTANSLTVNIAIPDDGNRTPILQQMKFNVNDKFSEVIAYRRYFFESGAVDSVISAGGEWSGTAAQAAASIVDRLA